MTGEIFLTTMGARRERGAVLIVGLVMLLLLTLIGLASIRGTDLQEAMAGNMRDRNLAFQSAEAGLRVGERFLSEDAFSGAVFDGSVVGYWPDLNKPDAIRTRPAYWTADDWKANSILLPANTLDGLSAQPRYAIEKLEVSAAAINQGGGVDIESLEKSEGSEYYRITSYGVGGTENSEVVIQSTFVR